MIAVTLDLAPGSIFTSTARTKSLESPHMDLPISSLNRDGAASHRSSWMTTTHHGRLARFHLPRAWKSTRKKPSGLCFLADNPASEKEGADALLLPLYLERGLPSPARDFAPVS